MPHLAFLLYRLLTRRIGCRAGRRTRARGRCAGRAGWWWSVCTCCACGGPARPRTAGGPPRAARPPRWTCWRRRPRRAPPTLKSQLHVSIGPSGWTCWRRRPERAPEALKFHLLTSVACEGGTHVWGPLCSCCTNGRFNMSVCSCPPESKDVRSLSVGMHCNFCMELGFCQPQGAAVGASAEAR